MCVYVCALLYVPDVRAWSVCCYIINMQQQNSSSSSMTPAVFQALVLLPVVTLYVTVVGARQEIEPRQHFHVQCINQTHMVGPHTRYSKHTAVAKAVAHTYNWDVYVLPLVLIIKTPPGYEVI